MALMNIIALALLPASAALLVSVTPRTSSIVMLTDAEAKIAYFAKRDAPTWGSSATSPAFAAALTVAPESAPAVVYTSED